MVGRATRGPVGGTETALVYTVLDLGLPGIDLSEAFTNWDDLWESHNTTSHKEPSRATDLQLLWKTPSRTQVCTPTPRTHLASLWTTAFRRARLRWIFSHRDDREWCSHHTADQGRCGLRQRWGYGCRNASAWAPYRRRDELHKRWHGEVRRWPSGLISQLNGSMCGLGKTVSHRRCIHLST